MLATITHIQPLTVINKQRLLPKAGKVLVRKGQSVVANDLIAITDNETTYVMLDIASGLGVSKQESDALIQCNIGNKIVEGDILAGPVGLTKRVVRAPKSGKVAMIGNGQILLAVSAQQYKLLAGIPGKVTELHEDRGVTITTIGAFIQGMWGNNRIDSGSIISLMRDVGDELKPESLDISLRGLIVLAGYCWDPMVIKIAEKLPLKGMILASIDSELLPLVEHVKFPIVVIEGFGRIPLNPNAYKILKTNEKRDVTICGEHFDHFIGKRPEIIIPLPGTSDLIPSQNKCNFESGQLVRMTRAPYQGKVGKIIKIHPQRKLLENGINAFVGDVRYDDGIIDPVPLLNLEVIM